jgi:hypothetical protein
LPRGFGTSKPIPDSNLGTFGIVDGLRPALVSDRHAGEPFKRDQRFLAGIGVDRRMKVCTVQPSTPESLPLAWTGVPVGRSGAAQDRPAANAPQMHVQHVQGEVVAVARPLRRIALTLAGQSIVVRRDPYFDLG